MSDQNNSTSETSSYDDRGAALYIAVILIWYSTGLALILFLQMRRRTYPKDYQHVQPDRKPFTDYHHIEADHQTKQILNELKDPERRKRLWKIYYSSTEAQSEPHPQYYQTISADTVVIDRIERKLATIDRSELRNDDEDVISPSIFSSKRFTSARRPDLMRVLSQPTESKSNRFTIEKVPEAHATIS